MRLIVVSLSLVLCCATLKSYRDAGRNRDVSECHIRLVYSDLRRFRPSACEAVASLIVPTCPNAPGTHWGKFSLLLDDRLHLAEVAAVDRDDLPPEVEHDREV